MQKANCQTVFILGRNRLILDLMARGGMHIGEVLKLRLKDLQDRKLVLRKRKSGKEHKFVIIPQEVADRIRNTHSRCEIRRVIGYSRFILITSRLSISEGL
jgi:integrase